MSMMKLLSAGRSLVDLKKTGSPYRMNDRFQLPKFGGEKNPFSTPVKKDPPAPAINTPPAKSQQDQQVEAKTPGTLKETKRIPLAAAQLKQTRRLPFAAARHGAPAGEKKKPILKGILQKLGGWLKKLNALAWEMYPGQKSKPAIPRFDKPATQGELSLDNVKVVRNDLNDSDLEIAPAKPFVPQTNFKPALQPHMKTSVTVSESCPT